MEKQAVITATDLCIGYRTHKGEKKVHERKVFVHFLLFFMGAITYT